MNTIIFLMSYPFAHPHSGYATAYYIITFAGLISARNLYRSGISEHHPILWIVCFFGSLIIDTNALLDVSVDFFKANTIVQYFFVGMYFLMVSLLVAMAGLLIVDVHKSRMNENE